MSLTNRTLEPHFRPWLLAALMVRRFLRGRRERRAARLSLWTEIPIAGDTGVTIFRSTPKELAPLRYARHSRRRRGPHNRPSYSAIIRGQPRVCTVCPARARARMASVAMVEGASQCSRFEIAATTAKVATDEGPDAIVYSRGTRGGMPSTEASPRRSFRRHRAGRRPL